MTRLSKFKLILKEEPTEYKVDDKEMYDSPEAIVDLVMKFTDLKYACEEYVYCICFDTKLHPLGFFEVSHGASNKSLCPMKNIFQKALFLGADSIILTHNHPSGSCEPSQDDLVVTERVKKAGEILEVNLLDHIIVTPSGESYSLFTNRKVR